MGSQSSKPEVVDRKKACPFLQERTGDLLEYSVIYTDRAINLMSVPFQDCMRDLDTMLKEIFHAKHCALIPGSGTYAMEAVARQFATGKKVMVIRNGFFSFRWSDIFKVCSIPSEDIVLKARMQDDSGEPPMAPVPLAEVLEEIRKQKPAVVFAPHVETSTGILLPDDYIKDVATAVHKVGGIFVLDAVAGGTLWPNMEGLDVDVVVTAPQKGLSGPACVGIVMLNDRARELSNKMEPTSFCCNLDKWLTVMDKYVNGGFMYYTTLPTDALMAFREVLLETRDTTGFAGSEQSARKLGKSIREAMTKHGFKSVAAEGFESPTVVVCYAQTDRMVAKFKELGVQIAAGVPFKCGEPEGIKTFRIGLFGVDKMRNPERTAHIFEDKLAQVVKALAEEA